MGEGNARGSEATPTRLPRPRWDPDRGLIPRRRLLERLDGTSRCPLLLIVAPAGYGKTTLLTEWDAADPRPFAWVTIDARDNDPAFFARTLAGVLDEIEPVGAEVFDLLAGARPGLAAALIPRMAAAVAARRQPCVLVLDDFDVIEDPQSLELVTVLAAALPAGSQIAVLARREPGLRLGRLRADGRLAEFGPQTLAMTRGEVASVLGLAEVELSSNALRELVEHTEGWPVAVYLAARTVVHEPILIFTILVHALQLRVAKKDFGSFMRTNMLATMIKLIIYSVFAVVYIVNDRENALTFVICLVIIYTVFSFIEVTELSNLSRKK